MKAGAIGDASSEEMSVPNKTRQDLNVEGDPQVKEEQARCRESCKCKSLEARICLAGSPTGRFSYG